MAARFDQAPVTDGAHVVGWIKTVNLTNAPNVRSAYRPLAESAIVSAQASMADVLELLGQYGFVFTVEEREINGFVTPSDLDRHAARSHFYLLVSGIEMLLAELVQQACSLEAIESQIREDVRERWVSALSRNSETHPVEYLYLEGLSTLFREAYGCTLRWTATLDHRLTTVCHFRPRVMHPTKSLISGMNSAQLASLARGAEDVTECLSNLLEA